MAESCVQDVEQPSTESNSTLSELSKTVSKSISTRSSPLDEAGDRTTARDTARSSRRVSLNVTLTDSKTMASNAGSAGTSTRVSPQPDQSAAAYGTRSRHRGVNRPNYAEDKESEMEFEYSITRATHNPDSKPRFSQKKDTHDTSTKKASHDNGNSKPSTASSVTALNEIILATHPAQPESKKRKAPGSSVTTSSSTPSHPPTRKSSTHHSSTRISTRDSSMVVFEKHGRRLRDGCLISDNGNKYKVNGRVMPVSVSQEKQHY